MNMSRGLHGRSPVKWSRITLGGLLVLFLITHSAGAAEETFKPPQGEALNAILTDFEGYLKKGMGEWKIPGLAVAIVQGDRIIYKGALGVRKLGAPEPVTENTLFQIGSTSKAFTTALVAMMVDEGKFKWNDPVINYLTDFRMYDPWVTSQCEIVDLMAQRSGLPEHSGDMQSFLGFDRAHIIESMKYQKPVSSFRSEFAYQNNMFLVAAKLVEKSTGRSWEDNVQSRIFTPLGMSASSTDLKSYRESSDVASLHVSREGQVVPLSMKWPYINWSYIYGPAGGINSTILDMTRWVRLQMGDGAFEGKRIISEKNLSFLHSPRTAAAEIAAVPNQYYCQGWVYRENGEYPIVWHNGGTTGHKTMVAFIPRLSLGIVVLSNLGGSELPDALAWYLFDLYQGRHPRDWSGEMLRTYREKSKQAAAEMPVRPAHPSPPSPFAVYTGEYANEAYGKVLVEAEGDRLRIIAGPAKIALPLRHWDRDIFMLAIPEYQNDGGFVTFMRDPEGKAASLSIYGLERDSLIFERTGGR